MMACLLHKLCQWPRLHSLAEVFLTIYEFKVLCYASLRQKWCPGLHQCETSGIFPHAIPPLPAVHVACAGMPAHVSDLANPPKSSKTVSQQPLCGLGDALLSAMGVLQPSPA